jgi:hypothetical protein
MRHEGTEHILSLDAARPWGAGVAFAHPDGCEREGAARDELVGPKKRSGHSLTQHGLIWRSDGLRREKIMGGRGRDVTFGVWNKHSFVSVGRSRAVQGHVIDIEFG